MRYGILGLLLLFTASMAFALDCGTLSTANTTYTMNQSLVGDCFTISAVNVTLDCAGYTIDGNATGNGITITSGSNYFNITNCIVTNAMGMSIDGSKYGTITNTSSDGVSNGIVFFNAAQNNTISNSTFTSNGSVGASLSGTARFNTFNRCYFYGYGGGTGFNFGLSSLGSGTNLVIANSTIASSDNYALTFAANGGRALIYNNTFFTDNASAGVPFIRFLAANVNNTFYWNNFTNNSVPIQDASSQNIWNTTINGREEGNIWFKVLSNSSYATGTPSAYGHDFYVAGIPYSEGNITDYAPLFLTTNLSACSNLTRANTVYTVTADIQVNATCFNVQAANITLDCAGHTITGNNASTYGVAVTTQANTRIKNCHALDFRRSFQLLTGAVGSVISNCTANSSATINIGILTTANNTIIANNSIWSGASNGNALSISSSNNIIYGNTLGSDITSIGGGVTLGVTANNNTFYWNRFLGGGTTYVSDSNGNTNYYNTTILGHNEGNIWGNVLNGSLNISGASKSSLNSSLYVGDAGSDYPYDQATSQGKFIADAQIGDFAPLTPLGNGGYLIVAYGEGGNASGNASNFTVPSVHNISATPDGNHTFLSWTGTGDCTVAAQIASTTVTVYSGTCSLTANFYQTTSQATSSSVKVILSLIAIILAVGLILLVLSMEVTIENLVACLLIAVIVIQVIIPYVMSA